MAGIRATLALAAIVVLASATAQAASFRFDQSSSTLKFEGDYDGAAIEGKFEQFSGTVEWDLSAPAQPRFALSIPTKSLNTDYEERDDTLRSAEWFDVEHFPEAKFTSDSACSPVPGNALQLSCPGNLTLRGKSKAVSLRLDLDPAKKRIVGSSVLNRRDFGVGSGEWDESGVIGEQIKVSFELVLQ